MKAQLFAGLVALAGGVFVFAPACTTQSYCFADCDDNGRAGNGAGGAPDAGNDSGLIIGGSAGAGGTLIIVQDSGADTCAPSNGGVEICDGKDNDCNGVIDDHIDYSNPRSCGTCSNNCIKGAPTGVTNPRCEVPAVRDGTQPGKCAYDCAPGHYDLDPNKPGCEYVCTPTADAGAKDLGGTQCGIDDDCDGLIDEDVNTCNDANNCGRCGRKCEIAHGTSKCVTTRTGTQACVFPGNTNCAIDKCDTGYYDVNKSPDDGCEYACTPTSPSSEVCDGKDNDCDGKIDNVDEDITAQDTNIGGSCFGSSVGECAVAAHAGIKKCIGGRIQCCDTDSNNVNSTNPQLPVTGLRNGVCDSANGPQVIVKNSQVEVCNGKDDDCDGVIDDQPTDEGGVCGSSVGNCNTGNQRCESGKLVCRGTTDAVPETCDGQDQNCDGVIDGTVVGTPTSCTSDAQCTGGQICMIRGSAADKVCALPPSEVGADCDVPKPPPTGATSPCKKGKLACVGGAKTCVGSITATATFDACGVDSNCDGALTNQPTFATDPKNCGSCGNDCSKLGGHAQFTCTTGACKPTGCDPGYIDCNGSPSTCETACSPTSNSEQCDGQDNNCNCQIDENVIAPAPAQVCDVSAGASDPACTGVSVTCSAGTWKCTFPAGYCTGSAPDYCTGTVDSCDGKDNNCNGNIDEDFKPPVLNQKYLNQPCFSDDGLATKHGVCQGAGVYVCAGPSATACNAVKDNSKATAEACDTLDNDCDGLIDEPYWNKGSNTQYFVKPAVTKIGASTWIFQYEASRAGASFADPGSGNGYQVSAPSGTPLEKTQACSVGGVLPWFNVTATEAEQVCAVRGGYLCNTSDWVSACQAGNSCTYGYSPRQSPANCQLPYSAGSRVCNIGLFDFDLDNTNGIQNVLLPTATPGLQNCWADWSGTSGNASGSDRIFDIEGNARELTKNGSNYSLMGGSYATQAESGATCSFKFYTVDNAFKLFDTGFRCCFNVDPTQ